MKLEKQVTSLELSKQLKELGVNPFNSYFAWAKVCQGKDKKGKWIWEYKVIKNTFQADIEFEPAFTQSELDKLIPEDYFCGRYLKGKNYHVINKEKVSRADARTGVDAKAKIVIYLIRNNLIKI